MNTRFRFSLPIFIITASIVLLLVNYISYYLHFPTYQYTIQEDGWVENWTAILLGLSGFTLIYYAISRKSSYSTIGLVVTILTALGLLFGCGEELSWGQRIFNIDSTTYFNENNLQQETNIHNLKINGIELNTVVFTYGLGLIFSIYFILFRPLYHKNKFFQDLIDTFYIPIPQLWQLTLFFCGTVLIILLQDDKKWELWELLFALTVYAIINYSYNKVYSKKELS